MQDSNQFHQCGASVHVVSNEESSPRGSSKTGPLRFHLENGSWTLKMTQIVGSAPQGSSEIDIRALLTSRRLGLLVGT